MFFKYELTQLVFYLRNNRIHSAQILGRKWVENLHDHRIASGRRFSPDLPFGNNCKRYFTCHGMFNEDEIFPTKEDLIKNLLNDEESA